MTLARTVAAAAVLVAAIATAAGGSAVDFVRATTDQALAALARDREAIRQDPGRVFTIVEEIVLPHFDFERMSRLVLGKHWRGATPEQQQAFVREFRTLLVRTYGTALAQYRDQQIRYKPSRSTGRPDEEVVRTEIVTAGSPSIPLDYVLRQETDGRWRVYDLTIDGISLVTNYRSSYGPLVQSRGLDGLIAELAENNRRPAN